jgi:hypothetical protein
MEEFVAACAGHPEDRLLVRPSTGGEFMVEAVNSQHIFLSAHDAARLRDWLNEFLEARV